MTAKILNRNDSDLIIYIKYNYKMPKAKADALDLKVELYDYIPHGKFQAGKMRLKFSGADANTQFANAIGRIMMDRLPTYAFARELINVTRIDPASGYRDSVALNHDMITLMMKDIPVSKIDPGISYLHERFWKDVDYLSEDRQIHENEKRIELHLDIRNESDEGTEDLLPVTTNEMQIYVEDELVELHDREFPYVLMHLKPKEQVKLGAKAVLGIGLRDACWGAACNYSIDTETEEGATLLMFRSASQYDEYVLMERALEYFKERIDLVANMMHKSYLQEEDKTTEFVAMIEGEDHTIGVPLGYELQSHPDVIAASGTMPDNLEQRVRIMIVTDNPDRMVDIIKESAQNLIDKIEVVQKQFDSIRKATYSTYHNDDGTSKFYDHSEVWNNDPSKSKSASSAKTASTAKTAKAAKTVKRRK